MKRTFIAIPVSPSSKLLELYRELRRQLSGNEIKWVDPGTLHLTIKFLGNTGETMIPGIIEKMDNAGAGFRKMKGSITSLDYFSLHGTPSVLFTKVSGLPGLEFLARQMDAAMETAGFTPEQRKFRPHLTMARIKQLQDKGKFLHLIQQYRDIEIQAFETGEVILYESILRQEGPLYIPLHTFNFPE